jgi:hypothetical protein
MHSGIYEVPSALAIRYLGAILELPNFWQLPRSIPNHYIVQKLLRRAIILIQDLGIEDEDLIDPAFNDTLDNEGIDLFIYATLRGIEGWVQKCGSKYLVEQPWWDDFMVVLKLLVK